MNKRDKNYIDETKKWFNNAKPNSYIVKELSYFEYNHKKYYVDGRNVVLDYSKEELEMAYFLENTFGSSKQTLYHAIHKSKNQSNNFIFDITYSNLW